MTCPNFRYLLPLILLLLSACSSLPTPPPSEPVKAFSGPVVSPVASDVTVYARLHRDDSGKYVLTDFCSPAEDRYAPANHPCDTQTFYGGKFKPVIGNYDWVNVSTMTPAFNTQKVFDLECVSVAWGAIDRCGQWALLNLYYKTNVDEAKTAVTNTAMLGIGWLFGLHEGSYQFDQAAFDQAVSEARSNMDINAVYQRYVANARNIITAGQQRAAANAASEKRQEAEQKKEDAKRMMAERQRLCAAQATPCRFDDQGRLYVQGPVGPGVYSYVHIVSDSDGVDGNGSAISDSVIEAKGVGVSGNNLHLQYNTIKAPVCISTPGIGNSFVGNDLECGQCVQQTSSLDIGNISMSNTCAGQ